MAGGEVHIHRPVIVRIEKQTFLNRSRKLTQRRISVMLRHKLHDIVHILGQQEIRESIFHRHPVRRIGIDYSEQVVHRVGVEHESVLALKITPSVSEQLIIHNRLVIT